MGTVELNTHVPHAARIYDYLLGGKDNFQADRDAAAELVRRLPSIAVSMRANRRFMTRAAGYLAADRGIRQFLDVGTGLPTSPNLHEVVQTVAPESRVLYVDNDPIVLLHARALLASAPEGRTAYLEADLRNVESILTSPELNNTLDLSRPVGVSLIAVLQFITDEAEALRIVEQLMRPLAAGSALAISVVTTDAAPAQGPGAVATYNARGMAQKARDRAETEALFAGLTLLDPGVVLVNRWNPDDAARAVDDAHVHMYGAVAVKT